MVSKTTKIKKRWEKKAHPTTKKVTGQSRRKRKASCALNYMRWREREKDLYRDWCYLSKKRRGYKKWGGASAEAGGTTSVGQERERDTWRCLYQVGIHYIPLNKGKRHGSWGNNHSLAKRHFAKNKYVNQRKRRESWGKKGVVSAHDQCRSGSKNLDQQNRAWARPK